MTTQYSPILKLALPVQGELSGTWGDVVNDNITSMVEQAIAGRAVINTWTTNSHTLTSANGTTSESRCAMLELTDTGTALSGAGTVVCPTASKIYIVKNAAGQNITVKTASGTGILVPNGRTTFLFCDGTNVVEALTHTTSLQLGTSTTVTAVLDEDNMASNSATSLATQQSIKAYVDAQVGANNELSEVLANGNTSGANDIIVDNGQKITVNTIDETTAGSGVTIDTVLLKDDGVNATNLEVTNIKANDGTAAGSIADSTGVVTVASAVLTTADINGGTADGVVIGGSTPAAATVTTATANTSLNIAGTVTVTSILDEDNMASDDPAGLATQQSIKAYVDAQVGANNEWSEVLANGNTSGATDAVITAGQKITTDTIDETTADAGVTIDSVLLKDDVVNATDIETSTISANDGTTAINIADSTGAVDIDTSLNVDGTVTSDGLTVDGDTAANGNLTITTSSNTMLDLIDTSSSFRPSIRFMKDDGGGAVQLHMLRNEDGNLNILRTASSVIQAKFKSNGDIAFLDDGGSSEGLSFDSSSSGLTLTNYDAGSGIGPDVNLYRDSASPATNDYLGRLRFTGNNSAGSGLAYARIETIARTTTAGSEDGFLTINTEVNGANTSRLEFEPSEAVFNETGADIDFRVESDTNTHMLFVDAGNSTVSINNGTAFANNTFFVNQTGDAAGIALGLTGRNDHRIEMQMSGVNNEGFTFLHNNTTDRQPLAYFARSGIFFNDDGNDQDFRVESDSNAYALFVDAGNDNVLIGGSAIDSAGTFGYRTSNDDIRHVRVSGSAGDTLIAAVSGLSNGFQITDDTSNNRTYKFHNLGAQSFFLGMTEAAFNEGGNDRDFRVESDTNTHMLFVDASANKVVFGSSGIPNVNGSSPRVYDAIVDNGISIGNGGFTHGFIGTGGTDGNVEIVSNSYPANAGSQRYVYIKGGSSGGGGPNELAHFSSGSGVVLNDDGVSNSDFRVESDTATHALFLDAGSNTVGIMDSTPSSTLSVGGNKSFVWNATGIDNVATTMIGNRTTTDNANSFAVSGTTHNTYYPSSWVVDSSHDGATNTTFFDLTAYGVKFGGWTGVMRLNTSQGASVHEALRLRDSEAVFNEASNNTDFRVESDTEANMFLIDAGANKAFIGGNADSYDANRLNIRGPSVVPGSNNGNVAIYSTDNMTSGVGGSLTFGGRYTTSGTYYMFGGIQAVKKNATSGNSAGTMKLYYVNSSNGTIPYHLADESEIQFNPDGNDVDFRVESENNTHMLYLNAEKDTVRLGNGGGNSAPLSFHKDKSSRYFGKFIDSTSAAAAKVADLMKIDSWQSGNSRLFGTVTFWSVNPIGDYANHGRASFFAKNTVSGTGNTVTTFTELEEKGTMALPTLTWTGTGLRTLTFNMPAVAYHKYIVDLTFVTADGATTTLYDDAAVGVDP